MKKILDLNAVKRILTTEKTLNGINPDKLQSSINHELELDARLTRYKSGETVFL